jgi:hypothetical protein
MYDNIVISVWINDRDTNDFLINIRLHALSTYLFDDGWGHKRDTRWYSLVYALYRWYNFDGWE